MSGFVWATGTCFGCRKPFNFNPHKVPSHRHEGTREPVCGDCMALVNANRKERGLEPFPIDPEAYNAMPEGEL